MQLNFFDDFRGQSLNQAYWHPFHLPHWSSQKQSAANYQLTPNGLKLFIAEGQQPWCPIVDGNTRVSNIQSAITAVELGSHSAQHRFKPGLVVTEAQTEDLRVLMREGTIEVRLQLSLEQNNVAALWLVGLESAPSESGELCVFEAVVFDGGADGIKVGLGSKSHHDPRFVGEFETFEVARANDWHVFKMVRGAGFAEFFIDGKKVFETAAVPDYPLQLMLGIYDLSASTERSGAMLVDYVRLNQPE